MKSRAFNNNLMMIVILLLFILAAVIIGVMIYSRAFAFGASGGPLSNRPEFAWNPTATADEFGTGAPLPTGVALATQVVVGPVPKDWDGAERVTVLVVGLDYRDWERGEGPPRTDTMMLLTLDPLSETAGMMSIPRDLWVNIPGFGYGRINTAYALGEINNYMGGGPGLAIDTVEALLGVEINYFAQIDFEAFEHFIDEIGGIEIDVPEEIKVDPIGPHNTVVLQPGRQTIDGPVALAYARARYTAGGDFDRAARQQQVIYAIRNRILQFDMLPTLMSRAPELYSEISSGVHTNMTLEEAFSLAWIAQQIDLDKIHEGIIAPPDHVILMKSPDGSQDILKPVMGKINILRDEIFAASAPVTPAIASAGEQERMEMEGARIVILNGSGVPELATRTQEYLENAGATIVLAGDADQFYGSTTIVDYTGNPYTVRYIRNLMSIESPYRHLEYNPTSEFDLIVYLGSDWANNNPMP